MNDARELSSALSALRRLARPRRADVESCDLCSAELGAAHEHLFDPASRRLRCACAPCALLFAADYHRRRAQLSEAGGRSTWKRVRRRVERLDGLVLDEPTWHALAIPIRLAFFTHDSAAGQVRAFYPSQAGATEAHLLPSAWTALVAANPPLATLEPDVEALLVDRRTDCARSYRVSIDECYRLVGLLKTHWRGFGGGPEVWRHIDQFFAELDGGAPCPT
jgi:hypothetical protein